MYLVLPEIFIICIIMPLRTFKTQLIIRFFRNGNVLLKTLINEFFSTALTIQYLFTLHVFAVLIYKFLKDNTALGSQYDIFVYCWIPFAIIVSLIIVESVKIKAFIKRLRGEEWLPIVDEQGIVKGKITKSVSLNMKNKFLHPVIRVALICKGEIYMQERSDDDILDPSALDHPFEKYILYNHEINLAVRNSIVKNLGYELPFRFLLKYSFENKTTKRLIFLFVSKLEKEEDIEKVSMLRGKFWTMKQIEEDFGDTSKFSECFQLEYEYLKNTVLTPSIHHKTEGVVHHA
ncbi:MAG: hypothetical protein ACLVKO_05005 [Dysgonomonas sp.]